jgi:hypothetical protein
MRSMVEGFLLAVSKLLHHAAALRGPPPREIAGRIYVFSRYPVRKIQ